MHISYINKRIFYIIRILHTHTNSHTHKLLLQLLLEYLFCTLFRQSFFAIKADLHVCKVFNTTASPHSLLYMNLTASPFSPINEPT